jgi:hypothetical protein
LPLFRLVKDDGGTASLRRLEAADLDGVCGLYPSTGDRSKGEADVSPVPLVFFDAFDESENVSAAGSVPILELLVFLLTLLICARLDRSPVDGKALDVVELIE